MKTYVTCFLFAFFALTSNVQAITAFYYTSSAQGWIGNGQTETLSDDQYTFTVSTLTNQTSFVGGIEPAKYGITFGLQSKTDSNFWTFGIGTESESSFEVGKTYTAAYLSAFWIQTFPGYSYPSGITSSLIFGGNGLYPANIGGNFTVLGLTTDANGKVTSAAIDLYQHNLVKGYEDYSNFVSIRYNSDVPLTTNFSPSPTPDAGSTIVQLSLVLAGLMFVHKKMRRKAH